jgi:hypothetical protein
VENKKYVKHTQVSDLTKIIREDFVRFLFCFLTTRNIGGAEVGIKESGIISIFHQSGKGHKQNGAETERGRNGKRHQGKRHNSFCSKPESGIKEKGITERNQGVVDG